MFQKGTRDRFLNLAGVSYGYLMFEGYQPLFIIVLERGQRILKDTVEQNILTADEVASIEREMTEHDILADFAAVVEKIKSVELPSELMDNWDFQICTNCSDAVAHGYIQHEGETIGAPYICLWSLFDDLRLNVREKVMTAEKAVIIFQKAISLNLPNTRGEAKAKFDALPEEVRLEYYCRTKLIKSLGIVLISDDTETNQRS